MLSARQVARRVVAAGLPVKAVHEVSEEADGAVELTPQVHIQVTEGGDYLLVTEFDDETFEFGDPAPLDQVIEQARKKLS